MKYSFMALTLFCVTFAFGHNNAQGIVAKRMDAMNEMATANKRLNLIKRGKADFDLSVVQESGLLLLQHSGQALIDLFPDGSLDAPSEANPEIWLQWETFSELAFDLTDAAENLTNLVEPTQFNKAYTAVTRTCTGCHRVFRTRR